MTTTNARHLVLVACIGWGHLRGLCVLAASVVKARPAFHVTFFTSRMMFDKVESEISRNFEDVDGTLRSHIRVVALTEDQVNFFDFGLFDKSFAEQFDKLVDGKPAWCAIKNAEIAVGAGRVPDTVIVDLFARDQLLHVRKALPQAKVYGWSPCPSSGLIPLIGPFGSDTKGLHRKAVEERMKLHNESFVDAAYEIVHPGRTDRVLQAPGMPTLYDHEIAAQRLPVPDFKIAGSYHVAAADIYHEADGIIIPTIEAYDPPESIAYLRDFFALTSRKLFVVGPLMSAVSGTNAVKQQTSSSAKFQEIEAFMARILESRGPRSLVYMAFGSAFWSDEPEKTWAFVDTMLEKKIPFIMSHSSPFAQVPPEMQVKVEASELGILTPWAPQQFILNNAVTGWFVSHCGINSTMEAIMSGVPIIAWPFGAEQALNACQSRDNLNIAYELFEVRCGNALKVHRTGKTHAGTVESVRAEAAEVFDLAFSADGEKKRKNILKLKEAAEQAWAVDGKGRQQFEDLLDSV